MKFFFALFAFSALVLAQDCEDDPTGEVAASGVSCALLKGMGCGVDLQTLKPDLAKGTFVKLVCPKSCDDCPAAAAAAPAAAPAAAAASSCEDDPTGEVAASGVSCAILKGMGCGVDLQTLKPDLAKGTFVKLVCPKSCDACDAAPAAPFVAAPAIAPASAPPAPSADAKESDADDDKDGEAPASAPASAPAAIKAEENVEEGRMCCMAMTASCLSCSAGKSLEDYCKENPDTPGCEESEPEEEKEECPVCEEKICPEAKQPAYMVRNNKNQNMCLQAEAEGKKIVLKVCNAKTESQHWTIEDGTLKNTAGCINKNMMMAKCDSKDLVKLGAQNGAAHKIMLGTRCLNMKGKNLNHLKCNGKAKTQGWVVQVQL